jgi:hypothetical protein
MIGENACRTSEARRSGSFHSDLERLSSPSKPPASGVLECDPFAPSAPPSSGRSEAETQAYEKIHETTPPPSGFSSMIPDWCVDAGCEMLALTTFELWEALERGKVLASMRVWREGLECWTPVGEIAEFSWAAASTPEPPTDTPIPAGDDTPSEAVRDVATPPPESGLRPSLNLEGARWVALGSAVAIVAVVTAMCVQWASAAPRVASAGAAFQPGPPITVETSVPASVFASAVAHHDERGQRRLPRGGRQAYGR